MKIQQINFPRINNIAKKKEDNCIQKSQLTTDCFEKSKNVSFRGSLLDELFGDSFIDSFLGTVNLFSKTLQKYHQELRIQAAIILFSDTTQKNKLSRLKQVKLEDIFGHVQDFKPAFPLFNAEILCAAFEPPPNIIFVLLCNKINTGASLEILSVSP